MIPQLETLAVCHVKGAQTRNHQRRDRQNNIGGIIPTKIKESLFLHQNSFTGEIPSELGTFVNGQFFTQQSAFNLRDNQLCGAVPSEVAALRA